MTLPEYGQVYFFTRNYGRWRSGTIISIELIDGPLKGHTVRYMHLGAVHPSMELDGIVERGQEIGVMGGTAVMQDLPHLHIDVTGPRARRVDPSPFIGITRRGERIPQLTSPHVLTLKHRQRGRLQTFL